MRVTTSIVVGVDLLTLLDQRPKSILYEDWINNWKRNWVQWLMQKDTKVGLFAISPDKERLSIAAGIDIVVWLTDFPDMSYNNFRKRLAGELSKELETRIDVNDVVAWNIQFDYDSSSKDEA